MEEDFCRFPAAVTLTLASKWRLTQSHCLAGVTQAFHSGISHCAGFGFPIKQFSLSVSLCHSVPRISSESAVPTSSHGNQECVCVFDTARLVMSEWRCNVYSFYLQSMRLASALVETFLSCYRWCHIWSVPSYTDSICLSENRRTDQTNAFRRLRCCCSHSELFYTHDEAVFCQNHSL